MSGYKSKKAMANSRGMINNEWDRDNLNFLLGLTDVEDLAAWQAQATEDDMLYAQELLDAYAEELRVKAEELKVECELGSLDTFKEASLVLDKFKLQ